MFGKTKANQTQAKAPISEEKQKRLIVATVAGAVILFVTLLSVMTWGMVRSLTYKRDIKNLEKAIAEYEMLIAEGEDTIEVRKSALWIEREARRLGYVYTGDNV